MRLPQAGDEAVSRCDRRFRHRPGTFAVRRRPLARRGARRVARRTRDPARRGVDAARRPGARGGGRTRDGGFARRGGRPVSRRASRFVRRAIESARDFAHRGPRVRRRVEPPGHSRSLRRARRPARGKHRRRGERSIQRGRARARRATQNSRCRADGWTESDAAVTRPARRRVRGRSHRTRRICENGARTHRRAVRAPHVQRASGAPPGVRGQGDVWNARAPRGDRVGGARERRDRSPGGHAVRSRRASSRSGRSLYSRATTPARSPPACCAWSMCSIRACSTPSRRHACRFQQTQPARRRSTRNRRSHFFHTRILVLPRTSSWRWLAESTSVCAAILAPAADARPGHAGDAARIRTQSRRGSRRSRRRDTNGWRPITF